MIINRILTIIFFHMKQFMTNKMVLAAIAVLPLFASCSSDEDSSSSGKSKELTVHLGIAQTVENTKANNPAAATMYQWGSNTNPSAFGGAETIGLFVRNYSTGLEYGFTTKNPSTLQDELTGPYDNMDYKSYGTGTSQAWTSTHSVVLSSNVNAKVCAYYPYLSTRSFDGNTYTYDAYLARQSTATTGNPSATAMSIACSSGVDYMYAAYADCVPVGSNINGDTPVLDIHMHHAQAVLKMSIEVSPDFSGTADLTDIRIHGGFAMNGTVNITDGSFTPIMPKNAGVPVAEDTIHVYHDDSSALKTLSTTTKYQGQWFMLPISETVPKDVTFEVKIAGHTYKATLSQYTLLRGWIYDIPLLLTNKGLIIHGVIIIPWETQSISTTPLLPAQ